MADAWSNLWPALATAALSALGAIVGAAITTARQFGRLEGTVGQALERLEQLEARVGKLETKESTRWKR